MTQIVFGEFVFYACILHSRFSLQIGHCEHLGFSASALVLSGCAPKLQHLIPMSIIHCFLAAAQRDQAVAREHHAMAAEDFLGQQARLVDCSKRANLAMHAFQTARTGLPTAGLSPPLPYSWLTPFLVFISSSLA